MTARSVDQTTLLAKIAASILQRRTLVRKRRDSTVKTDHRRKVLLQYRKDESSPSKKATRGCYKENQGKQRRFTGLDKTFKRDSLKKGRVV